MKIFADDDIEEMELKKKTAKAENFNYFTKQYR
jgi:hypothetical protein